MIELANLAQDALWTSNILTSANTGDDETRLEWGGGSRDATGFVNLWPNALSESGERTDYLVTRARTGERGTIKGLFPLVTMPASAEFQARVGFLESTPETSGAIFELRVHYRHNGRALSHRVFSLYKERDGTLADVTVDLSFLSGTDAQLELRVDTGEQPAEADLPIWEMPRIAERASALPLPTRFFNLRPIALTVNSRSERSGGGDDPFFGVVYFRTSLGVRGSTMVEVLDLLRNVGDNLGSNTTVPIGDEAAMVVSDVGLQSGETATIMGTIFVAVEEDKIGRSVVRDTLRKTADRIALFLKRTAEENTSVIFDDPEGFAENLQRAAAGEDLDAEPVGIGRTIRNEIFDTLHKIGAWFGRAHDLIGVNGVTLAVGPGAGLLVAIADSSTSRSYPVAELVNREFALDFTGDGGDWTLRVEVQEVEPTVTLSGNPTLMQV